MKQVDKSSYNFNAYAYKGRFVSYFHQIDEVLKYEPSSILEIGVGDLVFANYIKSNTKIEYKSIDVAEDLKSDFVGSVEALPFSSKTFDMICAFEVLEHIPFDKFSKCLEEMSRVSKKACIISLPHFGPSFKLLIKIPFVKELLFALKIPFTKRHMWNGQHYWEIGKKGYSLEKIREVISKYFAIKKEFVPFENQYHHFFILEPKNERNN